MGYPQDVISKLKSKMRPQEETLVLAKSVMGQTIAYTGLTELMRLQAKARIKLLITYLFPSPKFMHQRYRVRSTWVLPLYYPYRWWDMSCKMIVALRLVCAAKFLS